MVVCPFSTRSVRYSVLTPILEIKLIRSYYIMGEESTHHLDGAPKSVTGFTPICPNVVGTIALSWFLEEKVGRMKQKRVRRGMTAKGCMIWF